jgi:DNA-binding transcriptional LysR family regulator
MLQDARSTKQSSSVLPEYFVRRDIKAGRLEQLFPKKKLLSDHFRLVYKRERRDQDAIRKLAAAMRKEPLC